MESGVKVYYRVGKNLEIYCKLTFLEVKRNFLKKRFSNFNKVKN